MNQPTIKTEENDFTNAALAIAAEEPYLEYHHLENQPLIEGVVVNPLQREYFNATDNDDRCFDEIHDWFYVPYVVTDAYRINQNFSAGENDVKSKEFIKSWPSGMRYEVRCLDGGAWDRSTFIKSFKTLLEAVSFVKHNYDLDELYKVEELESDFDTKLYFARRINN